MEDDLRARLGGGRFEVGQVVDDDDAVGVQKRLPVVLPRVVAEEIVEGRLVVELEADLLGDTPAERRRRCPDGCQAHGDDSEEIGHAASLSPNGTTDLPR